MKRSYLIDTNVLIYSVDMMSSLFPLARYVIKRGEERSFFPYLSVQNISETYAIITSSRLSNPLSSKEAGELLLTLFTGRIFEILSINDKIVSSALNIAKERNIISQRFFDAVLAATIIEYQLTGIITNNPSDFLNLSFDVIPLEDIFKFF